jgi:hypothetical protein
MNCILSITRNINELLVDEFLNFFLSRSKERVYFQQPLNKSIGKQIGADYVGFNWVWAMERQKEWDWGSLTSNLLLVGQKVRSTE